MHLFSFTNSQAQAHWYLFVEPWFQFKDSGGFEALVTGKTTDMQRIDVNERITGLERLNPTPRPTT